MASNEVIFKTKVVFTINEFIKPLKPVEDIDDNEESADSEDNDSDDSEVEDEDNTSDGEDGGVFTSDNITIGSDEWQVSIQKTVTDEEKYVDVYLSLINTSDDTVDAEYVVYVRDSDGHPFNANHHKRDAFDSDGSGFEEFSKYSELLDQKDKYLPNNSLTLVYDIIVYKPTTGPKRRRHFGNSFLNKDLNDCRLVVRKKAFPVSKALLSDRSEVFYNMFTTSMSEKTTSDVVIDDILPVVFREFLQFLYFGDTKKMEEMAEELLYISDKYMVLDLKTICANLYYLRINPKNAFRVMEVMDKYGIQELVAKSIKYIKERLNQCLEKEWPKLVRGDSLIDQLNDALKSESRVKKTETMSYTYMSGL